MFKHILLATDGSAACSHAVRLAISMARDQGARLTAVFVVDPYPFIGIGQVNPMGFQAYMNAAQEHAARAHAEVQALCEEPGQTPIDLQLLMVEDTTPVEAIVQTAQAQNCDLVVLGSHGRSGVARLLMGSVATQVVAHSPVPVLIAK